MAIVFENIDTGETASIDRKSGGKYYAAKLSALINSSNMSVNADRGQDFGWRLQPEQQALIEQWEQDPETIDKVASFTKVPSDTLAHGDFLTYLLHTQELGTSPERVETAKRRGNQASYNDRVEALRTQGVAEAEAEAPVPTPPKTAKK